MKGIAKIDIGSALGQLKTPKFWKEFFLITLGMALVGAAVYYFLLPSKVVMGTISGLGIVISELLAGVGISLKVSTLVLILNILLLVLGYLLIGSEFGIKTAYASVILGPMMDLCEAVCPYQTLIEPGATTMMGDIWLDLLCFILLIGISQAMLFHINASTGGMDVIAKIVSKYTHMDIGVAVTVAGIVTCFFGIFIHPLRLVIIGIVGTWLNGLVIDYFMASLSKRKRVCIISDQNEQIRDFIINDIVRGCSIYEVTGGYSGQKRMEIQALLTKDEFATLMEYIRVSKIDAFITAGNVSEVYGFWSEHRKGGRKLQ